MRIANRTGHFLQAGSHLCFSSLSAFAAPNEALPVSGGHCCSLLQPRHTYAGLHCLSQEAETEAQLAGGCSGPGSSPKPLPTLAPSSDIPSKIAARLDHRGCSLLLPCLPARDCSQLLSAGGCSAFICSVYSLCMCVWGTRWGLDRCACFSSVTWNSVLSSPLMSSDLELGYQRSQLQQPWPLQGLCQLY